MYREATCTIGFTGTPSTTDSCSSVRRTWAPKWGGLCRPSSRQVNLPFLSQFCKNLRQNRLMLFVYPGIRDGNKLQKDGQRNSVDRTFTLVPFKLLCKRSRRFSVCGFSHWSKAFASDLSVCAEKAEPSSLFSNKEASCVARIWKGALASNSRSENGRRLPSLKRVLARLVTILL